MSRSALWPRTPYDPSIKVSNPIWCLALSVWWVYVSLTSLDLITDRMRLNQRPRALSSDDISKHGVLVALARISSLADQEQQSRVSGLGFHSMSEADAWYPDITDIG